MKKFSDYKDEEALDLWVDLLEPMTMIASDKQISEKYNSLNIAEFATYLIKEHKTEVLNIIELIDDTPVTAANLPIRIVENLVDMFSDGEAVAFFSSLSKMKQ